MASATATTAASTGTFDAALKDYYEGMIRKILNRQARLYAYLQKGSKDVTGRKVVFPVNVQGSPAAAFMAAGGTLPTASPQVLQESRIFMQEIWARIQVNADLIDQASSDRGAFERPVAFEIARMTDDVVEKMNRSAFGDGTGCIGEVLSVAGQVITLKDLNDAAGTAFNANTGNRYIKIGDIIDTGVAATAVTRASSLTVTAKSVSANTITVTGALGATAAGDGIYIANPASAVTTLRGLDPAGLGIIIDDGGLGATFQNINRTTFPTWQANVLTPPGASFASPGALTLDLLQTAVDMASEAGPGFPGVALMHYSTRREYLKLVQTDRRYLEKYKYDPGIQENHLKEWPWTTTLDFDGFPLAFDKHAPWRTIFALDPRGVRKWSWKDWYWLKTGRGGGDYLYLLPNVAGTYEAQGNASYNLGTDEVGPGSCTVIRHISVPIDAGGNPIGRADRE